MLSSRFQRRYLLTAFLVLLPTLGCAQAEPPRPTEVALQVYLDSVKDGKDCERRAAIFALHRIGKQAIPALVTRIADAQVAGSGTVDLQNPILSSVLPNFQRDQFAGVLYAYIIELILGRETLSAEAGKCDFLLAQDDYLYGHGAIRKDPNSPLEPADLSRIQQIYLKWWDANRNKTLTQLRSEWKQSIRPLSSSEYRWF